MPCPFCGAKAESREESITGSMLIGCSSFSCSSILLDWREWNDSVAWTLCRQMAEALEKFEKWDREIASDLCPGARNQELKIDGLAAMQEALESYRRTMGTKE